MVMTIVARLERADPGAQPAIIAEAWKLLNPAPSISEPGRANWARQAKRISALLDNRAFESAAVMLLPPNAQWRMGTSDIAGFSWYAEVRLSATDEYAHCLRAATAALALAAACLRAQLET